MEAIRYRLRMGKLLLGALLTCCWGCDWLVYGGFLDPTVLGSYHGPDRTLEIRKSISLSDEPEGIPGATDPTSEDTVAIYEEYRIGPGDQISVQMVNLMAEGEETGVAETVSNLGLIYLPGLKERFNVEGMTRWEAQLAIADLIRRRQWLHDPEVMVQVQAPRQLSFTIYGAVGSPGRYPLLRPDFRLLEAVTEVGVDLDTTKEIYVLRGTPAPKRRVEPDAALQTRPTDTSTAPSISPAEPQPGDDEREPFAPVALSTGLKGSGPPASRTTSAATSARAQSQTAPATSPTESDREELIRAVAPASGPTTPQTRPAATTQEVGLSKWIWLNGEWVEVRQGPTTTPQASMPAQSEEGVPPRLPAPHTQPKEIDWDELAEPEQRIIRIPTKALREGDPRYNIVVRDRDIINVPAGPVGEFYVGGMVQRPGVFALNGRQVNVKQALVAAGPLDILAWPERCEITRRIGEDREIIHQFDLRKIYEGKQEDFFLKPGDIIMVGTHAVAPFLATIRNSFRLSYGFGFVYDRNFADIDSFGNKLNPENQRLFGDQTASSLLPSLLR